MLKVALVTSQLPEFIYLPFRPFEVSLSGPGSATGVNSLATMPRTVMLKSNVLFVLEIILLKTVKVTLLSVVIVEMALLPTMVVAPT